jgi:hypothetical protein
VERLGLWTAQAMRRLRGIEAGGQKIAAAVGVSGALILVSGIVEIVATAVFYTSLAAAVVYLLYQWVKPGSAS